MFRRLTLIAAVIEFATPRYFIVGPAQHKIIIVRDCPEYNELPSVIRIQPHMHNKTVQLLNAIWNISSDIDEDVMLSLKSQKLDNYKTTVFAVDNAEACPTLNRYVGDLWKDIARQIGLQPGVCPIKKGVYRAKNIYIDLSKINIQMFLEGKFLTKVLLKRFNKPMLCCEVENIVEPQKMQ